MSKSTRKTLPEVVLLISRRFCWVAGVSAGSALSKIHGHDQLQ